MKKNEAVAFARRLANSSKVVLPQVQARLAEHVLAANNTEDLMKRLDYVADAVFLQSEYNQAACDGVWTVLVEKLCVNDMHAVIFSYYRHIVCDDLHASSLKNVGKRESYFNKARNRALDMFFCYLGDSLEAAIKFSLSLFEVVHESFAIANYGEGEMNRQLYDKGIYAAFHFFQVSMGLPKRKEIPISLWFHNIVEHAWNNEAANEVFRFVIDIMTDSGSKGIEIKNLSTLSVQESLNLKTNDNPVFGASSYQESELVKRLISRISSHGKVLRKEGEELLDWFVKNREAIMAVKAAKCREIVTSPARGLRASGADHIDIKISSLISNGMRSVAFYPEGCHFPDLNLKVNYLKWTPHLIPTQWTMHDFKLDSLMKKEIELSVVHEMLEVMVIDVMHRVIVNKSTQVNKEHRLARGVKETATEIEKSSEVRPHFRSLPEGWSASDRAKDLAERNQGWTLPVGKTFVQGHYRNGTIEYSATKPIMVYSDELFRNIIK